MGDWSSYALEDFLLFAPATYFRQYELLNVSLWPLQVVMLGLALALWWLTRPVRTVVNLAASWLLVPPWIVVAWWFFHQRYGQINPAADIFAILFAIEAGLFLVGVRIVRDTHMTTPLVAVPGRLLLAYAVLLHPLLVVVTGRSWSSIEVFGLAPDPTALATLGVLLGTRSVWVAWLAVIPLGWCLFSGLSYLAMDLPYGMLVPVIAIVAVLTRYALARSAHGIRTAS